MSNQQLNAGAFASSLDKEPFESIRIGVVGDYSWMNLDSHWKVHLADFDDAKDEGEQIKLLYGLYGLAVCQACIFEAGLKNLIIFSEGLSGKIRDINRAMKAVDRLTMGQLIKRFKASTNFDYVAEKLVRVSLRKRNFLVHKFWQRRFTFMNSEAGRRRLALELIRSSQLFKTTDFVMEPAIQMFMKEAAERQGIPFDQYKEYMEKLEEGMLNATY